LPLWLRTVPLFLSFVPCTSLRRSPSHPSLVCPIRSCTFPSLVLASSRTRSFSPLGRQSPLHWRSDRSSILSLRVYHSFPQQCCRRAEAILRDSTGVPYYLRKIFNKTGIISDREFFLWIQRYSIFFHLQYLCTDQMLYRSCKNIFDSQEYLCARFSVICEI